MFFDFGPRGFGGCHGPMGRPPFPPFYHHHHCLPGCGCLGCLFPVLGLLAAVTMVLRMVFWF